MIGAQRESCHNVGPATDGVGDVYVHVVPTSQEVRDHYPREALLALGDAKHNLVDGRLKDVDVREPHLHAKALMHTLRHRLDGRLPGGVARAVGAQDQDRCAWVVPHFAS